MTMIFKASYSGTFCYFLRVGE